MRSEHARWYAVGMAGLALVGLSLIAAPRTALAAVSGDIRAGVYPDADAVSVGGGVLAPVGNSGRWYFNPNLEVAMGDSRDIVAMSGDFHYDFAEQGQHLVLDGRRSGSSGHRPVLRKQRHRSGRQRPDRCGCAAR